MVRTYEILKQDGQATMTLKEQFLGDKFGMLTDKFGIKWMFNCPKKRKCIIE
jgi:PhnB protein